MTKSSETAFGPNTQEVLEWVDSQTSPFINAQLHEAFPWLEPNYLNLIIFRLYRKGLIDRLARGLWGPKGVAQLKRPTQTHPVLTLTPGTQIHLVHEALREFEESIERWIHMEGPIDSADVLEDIRNTYGPR